MLNWRQKSTTRSQLKLAIEDVLNTLPAAYDRPLYAQKCSALFEQVYESYPSGIRACMPPLRLGRR